MVTLCIIIIVLLDLTFVGDQLETDMMITLHVVFMLHFYNESMSFRGIGNVVDDELSHEIYGECFFSSLSI